MHNKIPYLNHNLRDTLHVGPNLCQSLPDHVPGVGLALERLDFPALDPHLDQGRYPVLVLPAEEVHVYTVLLDAGLQLPSLYTTARMNGRNISYQSTTSTMYILQFSF